MKIESIDGMSATASISDARRDISIAFIGDAKVGDYILVHAGFAIKKIDEAEAGETIALLNKLAAMASE
jgi:hydrogenase expression/formation protein HypC